jgi:hypothetical protein
MKKVWRAGWTPPVSLIGAFSSAQSGVLSTGTVYACRRKKMLKGFAIFSSSDQL